MDRTCCTVIVHDTPAHHVAALAGIVERYELQQLQDLPCPAPGPPPLRRIELGVAYEANEIVVGAADEIADLLEYRAPGAAWSVWCDPKDEHTGSLHVHVPHLGRYRTECSTDGAPMIPSNWLRRCVEQGRSVDDCCGWPHLDAVDALAHRRGHLVAEAPRHLVCVSPRHDIGWICAYGAPGHLLGTIRGVTAPERCPREVLREHGWELIGDLVPDRHPRLAGGDLLTGQACRIAPPPPPAALASPHDQHGPAASQAQPPEPT